MGYFTLIEYSRLGRIQMCYSLMYLRDTKGENYQKLKNMPIQTGKCKTKHKMVQRADGQGRTFMTCDICGSTPIEKEDGDKRLIGEVQDDTTKADSYE